MAISARISFESDDASPVSRERIRLLEALAREGSISGAARSVGLSYKAAWDAIDGMNNLFGRPLVGARAGGRRGGGAELTPDGARIVALYHRLESELAKTLHGLEGEFAESGLSAANLMWGFMMRTSARNVLRSTVLGIAEDGVNAEVTLEPAPGKTLTAVITCDSVRALGLIPGRPVLALIKSSFVILAPAGEVGRTSILNAIDGVVCRREDGPVNAEIALDIGGGKTLTAVITEKSAEALGLKEGVAATALIDAGHIIIAVD